MCAHACMVSWEHTSLFPNGISIGFSSFCRHHCIPKRPTNKNTQRTRYVTTTPAFHAAHVMRNKKNPARMMWNNGGQRLPITLTTVVVLTISRGLHCPRPICINHRVGQCGIECRYLIRYFRLHKNGSIYHQVCLLVQIIYSFSLVENFIQFNFQ